MALNDLELALKVKAVVKAHGKAHIGLSLNMFLDKRGQRVVGSCFIP